MHLTFLGTGTSFGVPVVGCDCETCTSEDVRDRRTRTAALVETDGGSLLVDTPPELRLQLLRNGVTAVDAVWLTHTHADHIHGIDDLRIFSARRKQALPVHLAREYVPEVQGRFRYIFDAAVQPPKGTTKPVLDLVPFEPGRPVTLLGREVHPVRVPHGPVSVYGFRVGDLGYVTDAKRLPPDALEALAGVRVLVLNALWYGRSHPTHFTVEEAVETARALDAERTYLIHLTHRVRHQELLDRLPDGVEPAYDGLRVVI